MGYSFRVARSGERDFCIQIQDTAPYRTESENTLPLLVRYHRT